MSDTPKTSALWSRVGAMVVTLDKLVVLRRECAQIERELRAERDALRAEVAALQSQVNAFYLGTPESRLLAMTKERDALRAELDRLTTRFAQTINGPTHMGEPVLHASGDRDAYEGCREDLLDWKKRGQKAEAECEALRAAAKRWKGLFAEALDAFNSRRPTDIEWSAMRDMAREARAALKEAK